MSTRTDRLDAVVGRLASVRDEELADEVHSAPATGLLARILESPVSADLTYQAPGASAARSSRAVRRRRRTRRPMRLVAFAAGLAGAAVLSIPAFGVGAEIASLFAGWHDAEAPVPTASDVVIASGEAGVSWKIVATRSDQGLCLGLFHRVGDDRLGSARCGYVDIRGDLPRDLRGDPASNCLGPASAAAPGGEVVPCGSLRRHWIDVGDAGTSAGLDHMFAFGALAEDVANVDLILSDGQTVRADVVAEPGGLPLNFYWAAWRCPLERVLDGPYAGEGLQECAEGAPHVKMAVASDAAGRVLERRMPAWNGNPTGDPNGQPPPS
jgi:hypothetical protein